MVHPAKKVVYDKSQKNPLFQVRGAGDSNFFSFRLLVFNMPCQGIAKFVLDIIAKFALDIIHMLKEGSDTTVLEGISYVYMVDV